jgi:flagellar biosynthesis repressor protein FlbT
MTGLVLKLNPKERVLINGVVVENGDRRAKLCILTPNASILRLRDAVHPNDANTPVKRVCYIIQLLLSGDAEEDAGKKQATLGISQLSQVFHEAQMQSVLKRAATFVASNQFYQALRELRALIAYEAKMLACAVQ